MAQEKLNSLLGILKDKRKNFKLLTKYPSGERLVLLSSKRGGKKVKPKVQQLPFKLPAFTQDPQRTAGCNSKWAVDTVVEVYNEIQISWLVGRLKRNVFLPQHVERMNLYEFELYTGVKVSMKHQPDLDRDPNYQRIVRGMPTLAYEMECCLMDASLPLGKIVAKISTDQEAADRALEQRRQLRVESIKRINQAIIDELPNLVDGGIRAVDFPVYHTDWSQDMETIAGYDAGF